MHVRNISNTEFQYLSSFLFRISALRIVDILFIVLLIFCLNEKVYDDDHETLWISLIRYRVLDNVPCTQYPSQLQYF